MIKNNSDYKEYIAAECGKILDSSTFLGCYIKSYLKFNPVSRFLLLLRTSELYLNEKKGFLNRIIFYAIKFQKYKLGLKLNFSIPENVAKKGLQLPHYGTIVINAKVRIGENCRLHVCTNIGTSGGDQKAPRIGNNVYIAPGVKIYGDIEIADNIAIAANSAVSKSFLENDIIIGGIPAQIIKRKKL